MNREPLATNPDQAWQENRKRRKQNLILLVAHAWARIGLVSEEEKINSNSRLDQAWEYYLLLYVSYFLAKAVAVHAIPSFC